MYLSCSSSLPVHCCIVAFYSTWYPLGAAAGAAAACTGTAAECCCADCCCPGQQSRGIRKVGRILPAARSCRPRTPYAGRILPDFSAFLDRVSQSPGAARFILKINGAELTGQCHSLFVHSTSSRHAAAYEVCYHVACIYCACIM